MKYWYKSCWCKSLGLLLRLCVFFGETTQVELYQPQSLEYKIVGFGVGLPKRAIRNRSRLTATRRNKAWNIGWNSIVLVPGCSSTHQIPRHEHSSMRSSARHASRFPSRTAWESGRPSGFFLDLKVLPIDLGRGKCGYSSMFQIHSRNPQILQETIKETILVDGIYNQGTPSQRCYTQVQIKLLILVLSWGYGTGNSQTRSLSTCSWSPSCISHRSEWLFFPPARLRMLNKWEAGKPVDFVGSNTSVAQTE